MQDVGGNSTIAIPAWPGWAKAACFFALAISAWATLIVPALFLLLD